MSKNEKDTLNKKLENIFHNYYQKIGLLASEEPVKKNYRQNFLRERFIERIMFTTLDEAGLSNLAGKSVLVVGLSHELVSFFLKLDVAPTGLTLADICPQVLEQARTIFSNRLAYAKINLDAFDLPDNAYDVIVCLNYLSNIPVNEYINGLAAEFYRVLKPGGLFLISFANELADRDTVQSSGVMRLFRPEEVLALFDSFKVINLLDIIPYSFARFKINEETAYPKKLGFIEDLLIEQRNRYSDSLLILSK